jgi:hypothetical protein
VCLLALLGAGNEHVDVLGHVLGFSAGIAAGVLLALIGVPQRRQWLYGMVALAAIGIAWLFALQHGRGV